jgi:hypothetical protein
MSLLGLIALWVFWYYLWKPQQAQIPDERIFTVDDQEKFVAWRDADTLIDKYFRIIAAEKELNQWHHWGVIEVAVRNPGVREYMEHWEGRATTAESQLAELEADNRALRAENALLKADVSDEEWDAYCENFIEVDNIGRAATTNDGSWARAQATYRQDVNALIRARTAPSQTRDEAGK